MEHLLILWDSFIFSFLQQMFIEYYYMPDTIVGDKAVKRNILCPGFCLYSPEETVSQMHSILGSDKF